MTFVLIVCNNLFFYLFLSSFKSVIHGRQEAIHTVMDMPKMHSGKSSVRWPKEKWYCKRVIAFVLYQFRLYIL